MRKNHRQRHAGTRAPTLSIFVLACIAPLRGGDWPTYRHDPARSGVSAERLSVPLAPLWSYRSRSAPQKAWPGPAKWDGWHKIRGLKDRMAFDAAFHVVAAADAVYFGSSADDTIYCLDSRTGDVRWSFATEGPIRCAPTVAQGQVYAGSDDGYVYCLSTDGALRWKHRPGPHDRRVAGNGRVISPWAIRSGVVVVEGVAYSCAGVFPSEIVYLVALDVTNGEEIWKTELRDLPAQGYLLASATRIYVPTGRDRPVVFDRKSGIRLYQVAAGGGGTYALLTGDTFYYGPGKTGEVSVHDVGQKDQLASFQGNHLIVSGPVAYLHKDTQLASLDRLRYLRVFAERSALARRRGDVEKELKKLSGKSGIDAGRARKLQAELVRLSAEIASRSEELKTCYRWSERCDSPHSLIAAGDHLVAGGTEAVQVFSSRTGEQVWQARVAGNALGLAVAGGHLYVSTHEGGIHCFAPSSEPECSPADPAPRPSSAADSSDRTPKSGAGPVREFASFPSIVGPFVELTGDAQVRVAWQTEEPVSSLLEIGVDLKSPRRFAAAEFKTRHDVVVPAIRNDVVYRFRIRGTTQEGKHYTTRDHEFDAAFNYAPVGVAEYPPPYPADEWTALYARTAERIVEASGIRKGYCLVVGAGEGRLAYHLARRTDLKIVAVGDDAASLTRARRALDRAGLHGGRVSVQRCRPGTLPYGPFLANLIVSDDMLFTGSLPASGPDIYRALRPSGGVAFLGKWSATPGRQLTRRELEDGIGSPGAAQGRSQFDEGDGLFVLHRRGPLSGAAEWTHQYGRADNTASIEDLLVRGPLQVLWWGAPGPRPMPDRGPRNPAPVFANGRLYVEGNRILFAIDAYNGTILWSQQIPDMRRANVPRDCSNMAAADDHLYVAMGPWCVGFHGQTGRRDLIFKVPVSSDQRLHDWGYLACVGSTLLGSTTKRGAHYAGDQGEWYDEYKTSEVARVTSDSLFALDRPGGSRRWVYRGGVILNSTITVGADAGNSVVYFVESRDPAALASESGRLFTEVQQDQHLVALDVDGGEQLWEKQCDFSRCQFMTYMSCARETLLVTGSDERKTYHTYAFNAKDGERLWEHHGEAKKTHHSGHLGHPVIIGNRVYLNKHVYDLRTGKVLKLDPFDYHGCGTMAASATAIFHRFEYHGMWDLETDIRTEFYGVRGGCWLGQIPSGGLLLAPESGSGCSCTHAIQTSITFVPASLAGAAEK